MCSFDLLKRKEKASYTVEAALVCPLLCLILCGTIYVTFALYEEVIDYGEQIIKAMEASGKNPEAVRIERMVCGWMEEE